MRGFKYRFAFAAFLAAACAWALSHADRFVLAQPPGKTDPKDKSKDKDKDKDLRTPDDDNLPILLPYERDAKRQLDVANDYLKFTTVPWPTVCDLLQRILDSKSDSFHAVPYKVMVNGKEEIRMQRLSVKTEANQIISKFPKDGLVVYQDLFGQAAAKLLSQAEKDDYDIAVLSDVSQRYFHTKAGARATILLGTIYLERGNYLEAAYSFERLLNRPDADDVLTGRVLYKAALSMRRSDDPRHAETLKQVMTRLDRAIVKDNGLVIGRRSLTIDQVQAELDAPGIAIRPAAYQNEWTMRYGNVARNATVDGGAPFLEPIYPPTRMIDKKRSAEHDLDGKAGDADDWIKEQLEVSFNEKRPGFPLPAFFPVATPEMLFFRSYDSVYAVATRDQVRRGKAVKAGQLLWHSYADYSVHRQASTSTEDATARRETTNWWATYQTMRANGILFENPLLGSLAHDGSNVYFLDDIAIPPPPVMQDPNFGGLPNVQPNYGHLADGIRAGELVAVNIQTGSRAWELGRLDPNKRKKIEVVPAPLTEDEADKTSDAFRLCIDAVFLGPPLPLNGRLYVMTEPGSGGPIRLLCLDPQVMVHPEGYPSFSVPTLLWSQKLGKPLNDLIKDPIRRYQGTFLAAGEGILICPTNSGAIIAVDVMSRSLLWAHAYRREEVKAPTNPNMGMPRTTTIQPLAENRWRSAAPIVSGGRVIVSAYDSNKLECLDIRTGKVIWEVPREVNDLYIGAVTHDKVIVVSRNKIRAYHLNKIAAGSEPPAPELAWQGSEAIPAPTGHGVAGRGFYFIPVRKENAGEGTIPAAEIWGLNIETGQVGPKTVARPKAGDDHERTEALARYGIGNLIFQDGTIFAQSPWEVAAYPQLDVKRAAMDKRLKDNPNDPVGLTERGVLLLDEGQLKESIVDFKSAEKNNPTDDIKKKIKENLYVAYTELMKSDFATAEQYLAEYENLCVAPTEIADPARRAEETLARRRQYLDLLAKGREKQGKLVEAFEHYLALATLGGDKLRPDPEDPSVKVRSDVWARGRIDGMIRRTADPASRKLLETRVLKEWDDVKGGNDLKRLREFVTVFGPYFQVGAEAELKLSELLLATNNDGDAREAQSLLAHLRATAESPVIRAQATEFLAKLMIRNGLMEDAVAMYLQLGKEFPNVMIRDGKTGNDFLTELLTDKRLLPYLEPGRYPLPSRVRAEQMGGDSRGNFGPVFEVEPDGELLPAFRRLRFVMDVSGQGGGNGWAIRAYDRVTGVERCKFSDLTTMSVNMPANIPFSNFFHASGHLVVYQLGTWVYCMDLADRKERWRFNLLTDPPPGMSPNQPMMIQNNEVVIQLPDRTYMPLSHRVVIQNSYCALLTQDGLEVFDPTNKDRKLWTRRSLPDRTQIFGDSRYLLLVEMGADRKPTATRLLRAVDGMAVDGAPDVSALLSGAKSYRAFGRAVLLLETNANGGKVVRLLDCATGKDFWRKEYDAKALFLNHMNSEWTGAVRPDGLIEVLNTQTGNTVANLQIDKDYVAAHVGPAFEAQLFADRDRFFVILDKEGGVVNRNVYSYNFTLRNQSVNGPMYCFDRSTGNRLWFTEDASLLEGQRMILDQFADVPVLVFGSPILERKGGVSHYVFKVVVIEKERGMIRYNGAVGNPQNGSFFQNMSIDPRTGVIDYHRYDVRLSIKPEDESRKH